MKIKVVNAKDIFKYFSKVFFTLGIISILVNFFYARRNVSSCISINSSKLMTILSEEIVFFKSKDNLNNNLVNYKNVDYKKQVINNEIDMIKLVATQNLNNVNLVNENDNRKYYRTRK